VKKIEWLVGFLTFVRSAHYWTLMHPELGLEDDLTELLRQNEELASLRSEDEEAAHLEMGTRLWRSRKMAQCPVHRCAHSPL
jgi:hypothetical protein